MKKFLIIGSLNAVTYKDVFPLLKDNKIWLGDSKNLDFILPDGTIKGATSRWFTNLDHSNRHKPLKLTERYSLDKYPKYDNYDAIEVSKTKDIPMDYDGVMGVPVTFMDRYCPSQFEIIGSFNNSSLAIKEAEGYVLSNDTPIIYNGVETWWNGPVINKRSIYKRICIKRRK